MQRFWSDFENYCNTKYPTVLKKNLQESGIDQVLFTDINEEIIKQIEEAVNENKNCLKNSVYAHFCDKGEPFKFLFGHRLCLLNLPQKYIEFREHLKLKKKLRKECISNLKIRKISIHNNNNELDNESVSGPLRLQNLLIRKLNKYAEKTYKNKYTITKNEVQEKLLDSKQFQPTYCDSFWEKR